MLEIVRRMTSLCDGIIAGLSARVSRCLEDAADFGFQDPSLPSAASPDLTAPITDADTDNAGAFYFSTEEVAPEDRMEYWRENKQRHFGMTDVAYHADAPVRATALGRSFGSVQLAIVTVNGLQGGRYSAVRRAWPSGTTRDAQCVIRVLLEGRGRVIQSDQEVTLLPGDIAVFDELQPLSAELQGDGASLYAFIPATSMKNRTYNYLQATGVRFRANSPLNKMARTFLLKLAEVGAEATPKCQERLADHAIDLVSIMLAEETNDLASPSAHRSALLYRIKRYIDDNLADCDLDERQIALAFRVTPRYVAKLFAEEGTTIRRFILGRRLHGCRQILEEKHSRGRAISEIARSYGLYNPSHFSRAFAEAFGHSPRAYRKRALT